MYLPYDPEVPFLSIHLGKKHTSEKYKTSTTALFTMVNTQKQPKCPLTDNWIKKMWYAYTHTGILLSFKKGWKNVICSNINGPRDNTNWNKSEKQISYDITYICWI